MLRGQDRSPRTSARVSFWLLALLLGLFLFAAAAPSPLYPVWAAEWRFEPSTLTEIYAVYAFGALAALLVTGRLSDHVGRRRVVAIGIVVQILGLAAFIIARGTIELFVGRTLQGIATGIAASAISAWLLDLQPRDDPRLGGLVGVIAPVAGLGTGALAAGLLVEYAPDPTHLVFWVLIVVFALGLMAMPFLPDVARRTAGWVASLRPRVAVPPQARSTFVALAPSLVAVWSLGGLYLALGPSLAASLLGTGGHVAGAAVIFALLGAAAVASAVVRYADAHEMVKRGSFLLLAGVAVTLAGVAIRSPAGLYAGSLVAGIGFGLAFSGIFRGLAGLAPLNARGALVAAIYIALYVAFSVPTIVAGVAVTSYGLLDTTYAYGILVMLLAVATLYLTARSSRPIARVG